jgi:DNA-binding MarR family transcriptional regulator
LPYEKNAESRIESTISSFNDSELSVLQLISESESVTDRLTQRELARRTGISLGMVNILVKRLAERGWVMLTRVSAKTMRYALTPAGVSELTRRTAGYFQRASRSADLYRDRLESFAIEAKRGGAGTVVLVGSSEIEFLLAYVCERHGLVFVRSADPEKSISLGRKEGVILLLSENFDAAVFDAAGRPPASLAEVLAEPGSARTSSRE